MADPIVETNYGKIQGFSLTLENGLEADVFLRVPFAQAPIENLRLEKPQPPKKWEGVHDSTYFSPSCTQHGRNPSITDTDEDSLYLNIIAPQKKSSESYPVLFWIHASGWATGSGVSHGYKGIAERWAPQGIIVVTINYRLGALGWMSTGTKSFPGNLGLWDQLAALKFVNENIKYFGGDPNRITVWGASAGGASASALGLSPHSRDLFQQAIQMSNSL
uniref:Carboxylic ester hydrolase n=1 Tax=Acrobeloides nanus TaxID=290746 RepID=A0A914CEU9_9BILA